MMTQAAIAAPDASTDPQIDPRVRAFLAELNKDTSPFWEKPGPEVRAVLTGLQAKTPVDLSGIAISEKTIAENGQRVKLYIVKPEKVTGRPPVLLFIHGGVWIAGDFENHRRLVRDLVVGSGAAAVFIEYTPIPDAIFPTQVEQNYAAAKWVAEHGAEIGVDGSRIAVAGNSVGGDMSAALTLMAKDRGGPNIRLQVLLIPATDTNFETESYRSFRHRPFPAPGLHAVRLEALRTGREDSQESLCGSAKSQHRAASWAAAGADHHRGERSAPRRR
jgi:acetyl esterase/lipase